MKKRSALSLLIGTLVLSTAADGNDQSAVTERARLANVMVEIQYIQQFLAETQSARKHNIRTRFDYDKLNRELDVIKKGIGEYVDQKLSQPKQTAATAQTISGSYQQ